MSEKPKRRRMRGEILAAARRLFPYIKPHAAGVVILFVVTLTYAGADAARAWLLKPLFNHILLRGSVTTETIEDARLTEGANQTDVEEAKGRAFKQGLVADVLKKDNLDLGPSPIPRDATSALRNDPLAKLLVASR
ncbi:hypothetical protein HY251_06610, partial [bacterium]|nr:hypothetical protein [bacterium]